VRVLLDLGDSLAHTKISLVMLLDDIVMCLQCFILSDS